MVFVEVKGGWYILRLISLACIRGFYLRQDEAGYSLWAEADTGQAYLVGRAPDEAAAWGLVFRLADALSAAGACIIPNLAD